MRIVVESMEAGTVFMVALETNLHRTGDGRYRPVSTKHQDHTGRPMVDASTVEAEKLNGILFQNQRSHLGLDRNLLEIR